jgi:hypothetical protein
VLLAAPAPVEVVLVAGFAWGAALYVVLTVLVVAWVARRAAGALDGGVARPPEQDVSRSRP